jgi:hypothetical protein
MEMSRRSQRNHSPDFLMGVFPHPNARFPTTRNPFPNRTEHSRPRDPGLGNPDRSKARSSPILIPILSAESGDSGLCTRVFPPSSLVILVNRNSLAEDARPKTHETNGTPYVPAVNHRTSNQGSHAANGGREDPVFPSPRNEPILSQRYQSTQSTSQPPRPVPSCTPRHGDNAEAFPKTPLPRPLPWNNPSQRSIPTPKLGGWMRQNRGCRTEPQTEWSFQRVEYRANRWPFRG